MKVFKNYKTNDCNCPDFTNVTPDQYCGPDPTNPTFSDSKATVSNRFDFTITANVDSDETTAKPGIVYNWIIESATPANDPRVTAINAVVDTKKGTGITVDSTLFDPHTTYKMRFWYTDMFGNNRTGTHDFIFTVTIGDYSIA